MDVKLLLFFKKYFVHIFIICNVLGWYNVLYNLYIYDTKKSIFVILAGVIVSRMFFHYIYQFDEEFDVIDIIFAHQFIVPIVYVDVAIGTWIPYAIIQYFF